MNEHVENKTTRKEEKKRKIAFFLLVIIVTVIILLLFYRFFTSFFKMNSNQKTTGNIDIFEIKCNDNCACSGNIQYQQPIKKIDNDSSLTNISISKGTLDFNSKNYNYNVLLENSVDRITLSAVKSSDKATLYYIYNKKVYDTFANIPISVGENIATLAVIAESGNVTSYRVIITRLNKKGEIENPIKKDSNSNLTNISVSDKTLSFDKNVKNYTVQVESNVDKITLVATKESDKATISYIYNGKSSSDFKDIEIFEGNNIVTILVTAEDGTSTSYIVTIVKESGNLGGLEWDSVNKLNIFRNPVYNGEAVIAPGSSNSYEFVVRNKTNGKVKYQFAFKEDSDYAINMRYRLKRNGKYVVGNESTWVRYDELNLSSLEIDYHREDDYVLDWKWFDSENDNLIGKLQDDYTLSISLSAVTQE